MMVMCCVFLQVGRNALHIAAENGHADVVDRLLNTHSDLIRQTDNVSEHIMQFSN